MNRNEKRERRAFIGEHLDASNSRLKDNEVDFLCDFIGDYDDKYRGQTKTTKSSHDGWSSDGKYTRWEENTSTFSDEISIRQEYKYHDDDGQCGGCSNEIKDARGILNWFKNNR